MPEGLSSSDVAGEMSRHKAHAADHDAGGGIRHERRGTEP